MSRRWWNDVAALVGIPASIVTVLAFVLAFRGIGPLSEVGPFSQDRQEDNSTSGRVTTTLDPRTQTGKRLTVECAGPPRTDGIVRAVDQGATVPTGTLVVLRQVDNASGNEWVEYGCLSREIVAGRSGLTAYDIWTGYSSVLKSRSDACGQAIADDKNALVAGSWNNRYLVQFLGEDGRFGPVPPTCPAR